MIAHLVLFTPRPGIGGPEMRAFATSVADSLRAIEHISRAIVGRRIDVDPGYSRSMGDKTYQYAAVLEFEDQAALLGYLRHPLHQELGRLFWETCAETVISEVEFVDGKDPEIVGFLTE